MPAAPASSAASPDGAPLVRVAHDHGGTVATLTLDSPHNRNALSQRLLTELAAAVEDASADPQVRVVVLEAEGKAFCSGADLSERLAAAAGEAPKASGATVPDVLTLIAQSPKPVVAKVGGPVRAGGIGLVATCDLAIGADEATFAFTEVRVGVAPAVIAVPCGRVMDPRALTRYTLTGETFDGRAAAAAGLLTEAVPAAELDQAVNDITASFLKASPNAVKETKQLLADLRGKPWHEAIDQASALSDLLFNSEDGQEGMAAFLEKRAPRWSTS